jgi:hypothetical protein
MMTKEYAVRSDVVDVEVYMADQSPPALYDFYVARAGGIRKMHLAVGIPGLIQVVMEGDSPTGRQILQVRRLFEIDERFRLMRFY